MPKIRANRDTWLKVDTSPSDRLPENSKVAIGTGEEIDINWMLPDLHQHSRVELKKPLKGKFNWFIFKDHFDPVAGLSTLWQKPNLNRDISISGVPFFAQVDSRHDGWRYCFAHACAMAIATLKPDFISRARANGFQQPENYYISKLRGDTTDHRAQVQAMKEFGVDAYFSMSVSPADLQMALSKGVPVPIGVAFKASGHWILVKGLKDGNYIINDPYGIRNGASDSYFQIASDRNRAGENDIYSPDVMDRVFWDQRVNSDRECGWAVMITAIDGKSTGIPVGL